MMHTKFILPVLQHTDIILFAVALISVLFFFFYVKVKFQKTASSKAYGILFYSFVFYGIAAFSFVCLNAMSRFLRLSGDLYGNYIWFFPLSFLSAVFGSICGWLIYFAASKVAQPYAYKLLNLSLLIIAPTLTYTLLLKPFNESLSMLQISDKIIAEPGFINTLNYTSLNQKPSEIFFPATPAMYHDSLDISVIRGKTIRIQSKQNGFVYEHRLNSTLQTIYSVDLNKKKYLALLALSPPLDNFSVLLVFDKLGDCVYKKIFDDFPNRLSGNKDGRFLLLQKEVEPDSLTFKLCFQLN
ncbi:MAG: hypothetical protein H7296_07895 [Bacteroidia bacterium]|nr:hypothetical protein [Bacteroidia bacterium]